jgi:hypothetical protein
MLGDWFDAGEVLPTFLEVKDSFSREVQQSCRYIGSHFSYKNFADVRRGSNRRWRTITVLREPRRRTLSHLRYVQRGMDPEHPFFSQLRSVSLLEALAIESLRAEFANYQARYLVHALTPEGNEPSNARFVLQDQVEIVGLVECLEASLLLAAYTWSMPPLGPSRVVNADPDTSASQRDAQLIATIPDTLGEMNILDDELYSLGKERFLRDFARMCDELRLPRVDPLTASGAALAPIVLAVEANVMARRRVVPGPSGRALVLRVQGAAALDLFPPEHPEAILLRPTLTTDGPVTVLVDTGGRPIGRISIVTAPPYDGAEWQPMLSVDECDSHVTLVGRKGYYLRWESTINKEHEDRFSTINVHLPRLGTTDEFLPALVSLTVTLLP